jgi:type II secretory pathway component GspD/PulD (secretin)
VRSEETPATDTTPLQRKTYEVHQCSDGTSSESGDSLPDRQLGLTLEVVPTISYGGDIMLDIGVHQIVADQVSGVRNRPPNTTNMDLTNRMIAQDGEIIVIGGNHALKESNGSSNLPGQKGSKFMGVTSQNDTFKEMLVFLSVRKL